MICPLLIMHWTDKYCIYTETDICIDISIAISNPYLTQPCKLTKKQSKTCYCRHFSSEEKVIQLVTVYTNLGIRRRWCIFPNHRLDDPRDRNIPLRIFRYIRAALGDCTSDGTTSWDHIPAIRYLRHRLSTHSPVKHCWTAFSASK